MASMRDNYYKDDQVIYYPAESVNFIVDQWREFTNGDAFPVNETEFPRMDEFIGYLKREGHFEKLQGRNMFTNLDGMPYFWEFVLTPVHSIPIDGDDDVISVGAERLLSPVDYGPGFEGFVRSLLYHMMNKNWVNDEMNVAGSGFELSMDVYFRARLLRFDGINCADDRDYDCGKYFKIKVKGTPLKSIDRKLTRVGDFYKVLLFDVPKQKLGENEHCVYKALKLVNPQIDARFNREYDGFNDVKNACQMNLLEKNWSLYEIEEIGDHWEFGDFYENVHKNTKVAFLFFIVGKHLKVTTLEGKAGTEYLRGKCEACGKMVRLSDLHFINCPSRQNPNEIYVDADLEMKEYGIEHVRDMEKISSDKIEKCILSLRNKQSIYVNGPGGSGKSELIKRIQEEFDVQVLGSTAEVARMFHGGQTVHSFFKLGGARKNGGMREKYEKDPVAFQRFINKKYASCPNYIVIDEAGMLKGEDIDDVDFICRGIRQEYQKYFGGVVFIIVLDETQLQAVKSRVPMYTTEPIIKLRENSFTFDSPWRLRKGVSDDEELLEQFKYLESIRFGIARVNKFIGFVTDKHMNYAGLDGVVLVTKNATARKINELIFSDKEFIKPWDNNHFSFFMGMEVICISNIAKFYGSKKLINGDRGIVIGSEQYNGETVVCVRFGDEECKFKSYKGEKEHVVDLVPSRVITVNRSQGMTIDGPVYIKGVSKSDYGFGDGKLYVAISRCTNLRNVTIIVNHERDIDGFLNENLRSSELAVAVANKPEKLQPFNLAQNEDGFFENYDNKKKKAVFTFKDKRYFVPEDKKWKRKKLLHDYRFTEYSRLFQHAIIVDHETADGLDGSQHVVCVYVKYYVSGEPTHFNKLLGEYGKIDGHFKPKSKVKPEYKWDNEFKMMEFSMDVSESPIKQLCLGICMILEMRGVYLKARGKALPDQWSSITDYPMVDWGFNNNGFDIFFFLKEYLEDEKWNFQPQIINSGSNLKLFQLTFDNKGETKVIYETRDLMQIVGGNFAGAVNSWCKNIKEDLIAERNYDKYITPASFKDFEDYCDKRGPGFEYGELRKDYDFFLKGKKKELKNIERLARNIKSYLKNGDIKKGFVPLKLVVEEWGINAEKWKSMPKVLNLFEMYGEHSFVENCFYEREREPVVEQLEKEGLAPFLHYELKTEYKNYARLDVFLTELLMRALNDTVYKFGSEIITPDGEKLCIESSRGDFISGTRTCLLRYTTSAQLVQQITFTNLPSECVESDMGITIETKICLLPRVYDKMVNGVLGGKTLARRMHFQSKGKGDYMQYADFSGMYMKILEDYEYPYGGYNYVKKGHNDGEISKREEQYRNKDEDLFNKCALYKVKVRTNPLEIEPVYGKKRKAKCIQYKTSEDTVYATNYELRVFSDYGVELISIEECIFWREQALMFSNVMRYYAGLKNAAEKSGDKVGRAFAKLMANSTFGTMAKSDKEECTMVWSTPQELLRIFKQHPACGNFIKAPTIRGKYHIGKMRTSNGRMNTNIPYIGRFTLGASKIMLYNAIRIGYGEDRFSDENFDNMLAYGDTDSITLHRKCVERLIEHDKGKDERDQILFYTNGSERFKAGKLTDELLDDIDKYFPDDRDYVNAVKAVNKDWNDVANLRIVEIFNPEAKSGGVKFKVPKFEYNGQVYEERFGYKVFCKGIPSTARVDVELPDRLAHLDKPPEVFKLGHNEETYNLARFAYAHGLPLKSWRQAVLKKYFLLNAKEYEDSIRAFDIKSITEGAKKSWGNVSNVLLEETFIVNDYTVPRTHKQPGEFSMNSSKRRRVLVDKEAIDSVKRGEKTMFEISSGQRLWNHY